MKIVIDIDERDYEFIKSVRSIMKNSDTFQRIATDLFRATRAGTPLPNDECVKDESTKKNLTYHWDVDTDEISYVTDEVE